MDTIFPALIVLAAGAAVGVIWLVRSWLAQHAKSGARSGTTAVTIVARQSLGGDASIAVVETEGRRFLLGVTRQAVTVLDRVDFDVVETTAIKVPSASVDVIKGSVSEETSDNHAQRRNHSVADERSPRRVAPDTAAADRAVAAISALEQNAGAPIPAPAAVSLPAPPSLHSFEAHSGGVPRLHPTPVVSFEQALSDARAIGARQEAAAELSAAEKLRPVTAPIPLLPATRRARREAEAAEALAAAKRPAMRRAAAASRA